MSSRKMKLSLLIATLLAVCLLAVIGVAQKGNQDVQGMIKLSNASSEDQVKIYSMLLEINNEHVLHYDELNQLGSSWSGHIDDLMHKVHNFHLKNEEQVVAYLENTKTMLTRDIEDYKTNRSLARNSSQYILSSIDSFNSSAFAGDKVLSSLQSMAFAFVLKPSQLGQEKVLAGVSDVESLVAKNASDSRFSAQFFQRLKRHIDLFFNASMKNVKVLLLVDDLTNSTFSNQFLSDLQGISETYTVVTVGASGALIVMILVLLTGVSRLSMATVASNRKLAQTNQELDGKVRKATKQLREQMEVLKDQKLRAEDATAAKGEFLANMSHEIRTPLNGISGMAQILKRTELTKDQISHVDTILSSTKSLSQVINDILDFSKIEAGKIEIEEMPFSLLQLIEETVDQITLLVNKSCNQLVINYHPDMPIGVNSDPSRIRQVLLNLISNANKFTQEGSIELKVEPIERDQKRFFRVSVIDSGIGISAEKLGHIFDAFSQEDASTTRKFGGTGLGLTICKRLSQIMGGDVEVTSEQGEGSQFSFYLPLLEADVPKPSSAGPLRHIKALIFDYNEVRLRAMQNHFRRWSLDYISYTDVTEFIVALNSLDSNERLQDVSCVIVNMEDYQESLCEALNEMPRKLPSLYLSPPFTEDFGQFDKALFVAEVRSPIKPSAFLDSLADAHSENLAVHSIEEEEQSYDFGGKRILLVDDNEINRMVAELLLQTVNVSVIMAEDGQQAIEKLSETDIDLVFMDCLLPEMDGYDASRAIRQLSLPSKRDVPIIAMTANAMKGDREMCLEAGMDDYISKPVEAEKLYKIMDKWIGHTHNEGLAASD
jgi:signal transduction histidine kinase/ActR/RegA family two-component response regulator